MYWVVKRSARRSKLTGGCLVVIVVVFAPVSPTPAWSRHENNGMSQDHRAAPIWGKQNHQMWAKPKAKGQRKKENILAMNKYWTDFFWFDETSCAWFCPVFFAVCKTWWEVEKFWWVLLSEVCLPSLGGGGNSVGWSQRAGWILRMGSWRDKPAPIKNRLPAPRGKNYVEAVGKKKCGAEWKGADELRSCWLGPWLRAGPL